MSIIFEDARREYHRQLMEAGVYTIDEYGIASNADVGDKAKVRRMGGPVNASAGIGQIMAQAMGVPVSNNKLDGQRAGRLFEGITTDFLSATFSKLQHLRPGSWVVQNLGNRNATTTADFAQYAHLAELQTLAAAHNELLAVLGNDYLVAPDIVIFRELVPDEEINAPADFVSPSICRAADLRAVNGGRPILHASISAKWTMRSDRAQNSRTEALNLVRNRKGRLPHIVVVTGEPLPSRLASLALGTGDLDCVYHFALYELQAAVAEYSRDGREDIAETLQQLVQGKRLKDISDLPLDLAT